MIKVLVFGVFDGIHNGHRAMLKEAKALGDYLVAILTSDKGVLELKGKPPKYTLSQRITALKNEHIVDEVGPGDKEFDSWKVLKKYKPDIIATGYDQEELRERLEAYFAASDIGASEDPERSRRMTIPYKRPKIVILQPFKPELFKSSLLNQ